MNIAEIAMIAGIAVISFALGVILGVCAEPIKNHVDMTLMRIRCHKDSLDQLQRAKAASEIVTAADRRPSTSDTFAVQQPKVGEA